MHRTGKERRRKTKTYKKTDLPIHTGRHRRVAFIRMALGGWNNQHRTGGERMHSHIQNPIKFNLHGGKGNLQAKNCQLRWEKPMCKGEGKNNNQTFSGGKSKPGWREINPGGGEVSKRGESKQEGGESAPGGREKQAGE